MTKDQNSVSCGIDAQFMAEILTHRGAFVKILQNEEQVAKDTLPIMLAELDDEIDIYLHPEKWERTTYSNGQWTYKRKEKQEGETK